MINGLELLRIVFLKVKFSSKIQKCFRFGHRGIHYFTDTAGILGLVGAIIIGILIWLAILK
jgi:hypothetical protein